MFEDTMIVQSAVSAFNNAALWAPAFMWWGILALPLFVVVALCGNAIMGRLGWNNENVQRNSALWTAGLTFAWVVLFGGNYDVLRDSLSVLPMVVATILFLTSLFVSSYLRDMPLPRFGWRSVLGVVLLMLAVGCSDLHAWWGPLLQIGACAVGVILGRFAKADMRLGAGMVLIILMTTVAMLMQPEFFRFGQLGNLTAFHLLTVLALGGAAVGTIVVSNVNARGKIRNSAFVKLKWLMRVVCALGAALFILTEAVPVFVGTLAAVFVSFALSVWHGDKKSSALGDRLFAAMLMLFGLITVMPAISALGILCWINVQGNSFWADFKRLL